MKKSPGTVFSEFWNLGNTDELCHVKLLSKLVEFHYVKILSKHVGFLHTKILPKHINF